MAESRTANLRLRFPPVWLGCMLGSDLQPSRTAALHLGCALNPSYGSIARGAEDHFSGMVLQNTHVTPVETGSSRERTPHKPAREPFPSATPLPWGVPPVDTTTYKT